jgi:DNA-binding transcriptional MerR regulator
MIINVNENPLRIGEVAARAAVSSDTIRYYERIGVLPKAARTNAGYRQYAESENWTPR